MGYVSSYSLFFLFVLFLFLFLSFWYIVLYAWFICSFQRADIICTNYWNGHHNCRAEWWPIPCVGDNSWWTGNSINILFVVCFYYFYLFIYFENFWSTSMLVKSQYCFCSFLMLNVEIRRTYTINVKINCLML